MNFINFLLLLGLMSSAEASYRDFAEESDSSNEVTKIFTRAKSGAASPQPSSPRSPKTGDALGLDEEDIQKICSALRATRLSARPSALITRTPSPTDAPIFMKKPTTPPQKVTERKRKRGGFSSSSHEGESPQKKFCREQTSRTSSADTAASASSSDRP